jgi:hypothetical protein
MQINMPVVQDGFEIELFFPFVTGGSVLMHALPCTLLILHSFKACFHHKYAKNPFNTHTDVCFSPPTLKLMIFISNFIFITASTQVCGSLFKIPP